MEQQQKTFIVFNSSNGEIIGNYTVYDVEAGSYRKPTIDEAHSAFQDILATKQVESLDILETGVPLGTPHSDYDVDVTRRKLVMKPHLQLQAARTQIEGDGQDAVVIEISVLDEGNNLVESFNGELRVSTSRGRLSTPGGRITAEHGKASITLTSAPETVEQVQVIARDPADRCIAGSIKLEFL